MSRRTYEVHRNCGTRVIYGGDPGDRCPFCPKCQKWLVEDGPVGATVRISKRTGRVVKQ